MRAEERYRKHANECVRIANTAMNILLNKGEFRYEDSKVYSKLVKQTIDFYRENQIDDISIDYQLLEAMVNGIIYHITNEIGGVSFRNNVYLFYLSDYASDLAYTLKLTKSTKLWVVSEIDYRASVAKYEALNRVSRAFKDISGMPARSNVRKGVYGIRARKLG